jgi:hypothetical protein
MLDGMEMHGVPSGDAAESSAVEEHAALFPIGTDEGPLADWVLSWSSVALAVHDADLRCVRENAAMQRLGREVVRPGAFAAAGRRCRLASLLADPDRDAWIALMRRVLRTGEPETDFRVRARTGTHPDHERVLSISVSPLRQEAGRVPGVCRPAGGAAQRRRALARPDHRRSGPAPYGERVGAGRCSRGGGAARGRRCPP